MDSRDAVKESKWQKQKLSIISMLFDYSREFIWGRENLLRRIRRGWGGRWADPEEDSATPRSLSSFYITWGPTEGKYHDMVGLGGDYSEIELENVQDKYETED